jgi:hypothetical protein
MQDAPYGGRGQGILPGRASSRSLQMYLFATSKENCLRIDV